MCGNITKKNKENDENKTHHSGYTYGVETHTGFKVIGEVLFPKANCTCRCFQYEYFNSLWT